MHLKQYLHWHTYMKEDLYIYSRPNKTPDITSITGQAIDMPPSWQCTMTASGKMLFSEWQSMQRLQSKSVAMPMTQQFRNCTVQHTQYWCCVGFNIYACDLALTTSQCPWHMNVSSWHIFIEIHEYEYTSALMETVNQIIQPMSWFQLSFKRASWVWLYINLYVFASANLMPMTPTTYR